MEQIAQTKTNGKKRALVPKTQSLSFTKTLENDGLLISKKGLKKPNGKGYSVGNVGEHTITTPVNVPTCSKSPTTSTVSNPESEDDDIPDFEDVPDLIEVNKATKLNHPGLMADRRESTSHEVNQHSTRGRGKGRGRPRGGRGRGRGQGKTSKIGRNTIGAQTKQTIR